MLILLKLGYTEKIAEYINILLCLILLGSAGTLIVELLRQGKSGQGLGETPGGGEYGWWSRHSAVTWCDPGSSPRHCLICSTSAGPGETGKEVTLEGHQQLPMEFLLLKRLQGKKNSQTCPQSHTWSQLPLVS